eukprot:5530270-Prymnesium_polylepis.1
MDDDDDERPPVCVVPTKEIGMDDDDDDLVALAATVRTAYTRSRVADDCVPRIAGPPSAPHFFERYVARSLPVVLTGCVDHWPALRAWTHAHLRGKLGTHPVHVALTPDGLADAVSERARLPPTGERCFARPSESLMPFSAFVDAIESPLHGADGALRRAVHYASHQNSSLETEFQPLWDEVERSLGWADAAFGRPPAAANFWMGEDAARTSVHADLFDNVYVVLRGEKNFTLLPPPEGHALGRRPYRAATWVEADAPDEEPASGAAARCGLALQADEPETFVPWTEMDLEREGAERGLRPIRATVRAGELLFLPALWWHAVSQRAPDDDAGGRSTIAVNF